MAEEDKREAKKHNIRMESRNRMYLTGVEDVLSFDTEEILLIRAAFAVLSDPSLAAVWNKADARVRQQVEDALKTEQNGAPVIYTEE